MATQSAVNEPEVATASLRRRVLRGVRWEAAGQLGVQSFRFVSNLILTRFLMPEAFGLIGLVQVFMMSLELLSDVGLRGSVIHHPRGHSREFLDTVWTVSLIRGGLLWGIGCLVAYPLAVFYGMPELAWLLPITGLSAVFRGSASTSLLTDSRDLQAKRPVIVDLGAQLIGMTGTILLAVLTRSVLSLAVGWVITGIAFSMLSHCGGAATRNRVYWDRDAARSLVSFGRWSIASSTLTIVQQRGDRLVLAKMLSVAGLGTYVIGANIVLLPMTLFYRINAGVAQPLYARLRSMPHAEARSRIRRFRLGVVLTHAPVLLLMVVFGQRLVDFVYPPRFAAAGGYLSFLALAALMRVGTDMGPVFPARGDMRTHFQITLVRTFALIGGMWAGFQLGSSVGHATGGVIYGVVLAPLVSYPYQALMYRRINAWLPEVDLLAIVPSLSLIAAQALGRI